MQTADEYNLPKRSRYYHSIIDADKLLMAGFLKYIDNSTTAVADETGSEFVGMIDRKVKSIKENLDEGVKFMQFEEMMAEREQKGEQRGIEKERLAIARKMLQDNVDEDTVVKYTGLSIDEVSEIRQSI